VNKDIIKKGKVIVIEGSDGSGKATQTKKLFDRLAEEGRNIKKVEYPNYGSDSSALVKMYLNGEFGSRPDDVNPYAASSFYAVDRYASYKKEWEQFYLDGGIVLADRYTTANMVHQASKIDDPVQWELFLDWLWDYEFVKLGLPVPDCVIFLDVDPSCSRRLMENRSNKISGEQDKDIHEKDPVFLQKSHASSCRVAEKYGWVRINCLESGILRDIDDIHQEIYSRILNII
jgi:dTMP kinase